MKNTLVFVSGAILLLLSISCDSSDPGDVDASIGDGAIAEPDGAAANGGTGGSILTGGAGGLTASGGISGAGGLSASGGVTGGGGQIMGTGGAATGGSSGIGGSGQVCGGIAGLPCPKKQFCEYPLGECSSIADATGTCSVLLEVCPTVYQPVCGCDGKTYGNDCERRAAGVSKLTSGECSTTGKMCGGIAGLACDKDEFCDLSPGDCGTIADGAGTCAQTGEGIGCEKIYRPVCGCDGRTYGNDCERRVAGISKRAEGTCPTTGKMCGGIAGLSCDKGQFCDLTSGDCGTIADGAGICAITGKSVVCDMVYLPVCGCDGKTYGNDCERQAAGVSKAADGVCPAIDGGVDR